jgi:hypothetical protein
MRQGFLTSAGGLAVLIAVASLTAATTTVAAETWTLPRTADGQPDLQGVWSFGTITPLERPRSLGAKAFFTDEEAASYEKEENRRQNRDLIDPKEGGLNYPPGGVIPYNEVWYERGTKVVKSKRTSLIVDPPDGRRGRGERSCARRSNATLSVDIPTPTRGKIDLCRNVASWG